MLRSYSCFSIAEDFTKAGWTSRPYPEDSPLPYSNLSPERESSWEREARNAIKHAARAFRGKDGSIRSGPSLVWRTLHAPPARHNYAPFPVRPIAAPAPHSF